MYKKAKGFQTNTGSGLIEADMQKGITLSQKLENICPHFTRVDAIYGERANISPPTWLEIGTGGLNQLGSDQLGPGGNEEGNTQLGSRATHFGIEG